jgi:formylglycine-generating enzyme required for sulfatase activity
MYTETEERYHRTFSSSIVKIDPGTFYFGRLEKDGEYAFLNDRRLTRLTAPFWIADSPVTNSEYTRFLAESGHKQDYSNIETWRGDWISDLPFEVALNNGSRCPVVGVSFFDALAYCDWASSMTGLTIRLCREVEFEFAAKAGCRCTWYCEAAKSIGAKLRHYGEYPATLPPTTKRGPANAWGIYDLNGLIWQWCLDWFWEYDPNAVADPSGPSSSPAFAPWKGQQLDAGRVIRGGSFAYGVLHSRCANRHFSPPTHRNFNLGFRIVVEDAEHSLLNL